jgi:hypothetical protein
MTASADVEEIIDAIMDVFTEMADLLIQYQRLSSKDLKESVVKCLKSKVLPTHIASTYKLGPQICDLQSLIKSKIDTQATVGVCSNDPTPPISQIDIKWIVFMHDGRAVARETNTNYVYEINADSISENTTIDTIIDKRSFIGVWKNNNIVEYDQGCPVTDCEKDEENDEEGETKKRSRPNAYHAYVKEMRPIVIKEFPKMAPNDIMEEVRDRWASYKYMNESYLHNKDKESFKKIRSLIEWYLGDKNLKHNETLKDQLIESGNIRISQLLKQYFLKTIVDTFIKIDDQESKELIIASALLDSKEVKLTNDYRGVMRIKPIKFVKCFKVINEYLFMREFINKYNIAIKYKTKPSIENCREAIELWTSSQSCKVEFVDKLTDAKDSKNEIVSEPLVSVSTSKPTPSTPANTSKNSDLLTRIQATLESVKKSVSKDAVDASESKPVPPSLEITKEESSDSDGDSKTKKRTPIPRYIKTLVWNQYIGEHRAEALCACCRKTQINIRHFHCGHVISEAKGGDSTLNNLRPICSNCNLAMGTMSMNEFAEKFFGWKVT